MQSLEELIRIELQRHGLSSYQVSVKLLGRRDDLSQALSGARNFSDKLFVKLVDEFHVWRNPAIMQAWLAAYLAVRFPMDAKRWLQIAKWHPALLIQTPSKEYLEEHGVTEALPNAVLDVFGSNVLYARRRYQALQGLELAGSKGLMAGDMAGGMQCLASEARNALIWLLKQEYAEARQSMGKRTIVIGDARKAVRGKLTTWAITEAGQKVLADLEHAE